MSHSALIGPVARLCDDVLAELPEGPMRSDIASIRARLEEPLRLAVAGRLSSGKSTLVNALLGRKLAPTDARECTRVVTWFHYDHPPRAELRMKDGTRRDLRLVGDDQVLPKELGVDRDDVEAIRVELSAASLRNLIIIDTPGLASLSSGVSATTEELLGVSSARAVAEAEALAFVITQEPRQDEKGAIAAFGRIHRTAVNTVAVLNKADLIGDGVDDLAPARDIARMSAADLRGQVSDVLPMCAHLAETAETEFTEENARHLCKLAELDPKAREDMLDSKEDFEAASTDVPVPERMRLLSLLGRYGIRRCLEWIDGGDTTAVPLKRHLRQLGGIEALEEALGGFERRADVIKADAALGALEALSYRETDAATDKALRNLRGRVEELRLRPDLFHELTSIWALQRSHSDDVDLPDDLRLDLERLATGETTRAKLGVDAESRNELAMAAAASGSERWLAFANGGRARLVEGQIAERVAQVYAALWMLEDRPMVPQ